MKKLTLHEMAEVLKTFSYASEHMLKELDKDNEFINEVFGLLDIKNLRSTHQKTHEPLGPSHCIRCLLVCLSKCMSEAQRDEREMLSAPKESQPK